MSKFGFLICTLSVAALLSACGPSDDKEKKEEAASAPAVTSESGVSPADTSEQSSGDEAAADVTEAAPTNFQCGKDPVQIMAEDPNSIRLQMGGTLAIVTKKEELSGVVYEAKDVKFTVKDSDASLALGKKKSVPCVAVAPGIRTDAEEYKAGGSDPAWTVSITKEKVTVAGADAAVLAEGKRPEADETDKARTYKVELDAKRTMNVIVTYVNCTDAGKVYPDQVTVELDGKVFSGCGGEGRDIPK